MSTMLTRYAMDVEELDREQAQTEIQKNHQTIQSSGPKTCQNLFGQKNHIVHFSQSGEFS